MPRKADLEQHIRESYKLVREFENILRLSDNPKEQTRSQRAIEEQWKLIEEYLAEYVRLCKKRGLAISDDITEIAAALGFQLPSPEQPPDPIPPEELAKTKETPRYARWLGIVVIVVILTLAVIGIWSLLSQGSSTTPPTPTETVVNLADARVRFTVTTGTGTRELLSQNTLHLRPGERASITMNVTVNQTPFPRDLTYRYYAPKGNIAETQGGLTVSYTAPEQSGPDIIAVLITDRATRNMLSRCIRVVIEKQTP